MCNAQDDKKESNISESDEKPSKQSDRTRSVSIVMLAFDNPANCNALGPLVDDATPKSGNGMADLHRLIDTILPGWNGSIDAKPKPFELLPIGSMVLWLTIVKGDQIRALLSSV